MNTKKQRSLTCIYHICICLHKSHKSMLVKESCKTCILFPLESFVPSMNTRHVCKCLYVCGVYPFFSTCERGWLRCRYLSDLIFTVQPVVLVIFLTNHHSLNELLTNRSSHCYSGFILRIIKCGTIAAIYAINWAEIQSKGLMNRKQRSTAMFFLVYRWS